MANETKNKVLNGLFWKIMENGGSQGIQFIISILLARLLSPEEYGIINLVLIFVTIANVIVQNGFGTALIQKQQADERDYSSVFFVNLLTAAVIYTLLFFQCALNLPLLRQSDSDFHYPGSCPGALSRSRDFRTDRLYFPANAV